MVESPFHSTTICAVEKDGKFAMAGDGQVTMGESVVMKGTAKKVRRIYNGEVVVGFAGSVADAFTLEEKFEGKLNEYNGNLQRAAVELAQEWRTQQSMQKLEAMLIVMNDKEMLRYFVDHSADAVDWLDQNGIKLDNLTITGGMSEKRTHRPSDGSAIGGYLVEGLLNNVHEREIPIFVNADVTDIKKNGETVNEVTVHVQGEEPKEVTGKAIVVTTGGFGASKEFIEKYRPDLADYITTNQEGSTGDGITMIEKLGGQTVDMDKIQIHPTVQQDEGVLIGEVVRGEGAILVDQEGKRFVNEMDTRDKVSAAITALPEKSAYLIFDQGVRDRATAIEFYDQKGYVTTGKTMEELAEKIDLPKETLAKTVDGWNTDVAEKKDAQFNRATAMEHDLSSPNYYAIKIAPGIHYTMGGVKINTNTEVLDKENQPIRGLYAAGEVTGGLHGNNRIGGNSVAEIIIFGRQAGIQAARFASENE
ncbi:flavocytochrome c [Enterococcus faecium]|nr:flavocytochrome c [Enterococcus faecium]